MSLCIVEFGSLMTAYNGFSIIAVALFGTTISSFFPVCSLYRRTLIYCGYQSKIWPTRMVWMSYEPETLGSVVVSTGTIATLPSSNMEITTSWIKERAVWSILASKVRQLFNPSSMTDRKRPFSSSLICWKLRAATSRAIRLYTDVTIERSLPLVSLGLSAL